MIHEIVQLTNMQVDGSAISLGALRLVNVVTDTLMVGCGAFDVMALDNFGYPAARVKSTTGSGIATIENLLSSIVKYATAGAIKRGVKIGMTGREALDLI